MSEYQKFMTRKEAALAYLKACRYTTNEVNALWNMLFQGLVDYRPKELQPKLNSIAQAISSPSWVYFPEGVDIPDDDDDDMGFRQTNDVSDYLRS